jgi:hypothetical protein
MSFISSSVGLSRPRNLNRQQNIDHLSSFRRGPETHPGEPESSPYLVHVSENGLQPQSRGKFSTKVEKYEFPFETAEARHFANVQLQHLDRPLRPIKGDVDPISEKNIE